MRDNYIDFTVEELEETRKTMWDKDYLPVLYKFLELKNGIKVLDVGCGTGYFTRMIASQINGEVVGIDINEQLLKYADEVTKREHLNVKYLKENIYELRLKDNYFDLVTCHLVLSNLSEPKIALKEMKRVTKRGGNIVAIEPCNSSAIQYFGDEPEIIDFGRLLLKAKKAFDDAMLQKGSDLDIGRRLPSLFYEVGLHDIDVRGYVVVNFAGKSDRKRLNFELSKIEQVVQKGYLSFDEFEKIKNIFESKKISGAIQGLPLLIVKGKKK